MNLRGLPAENHLVAYQGCTDRLEIVLHLRRHAMTLDGAGLCVCTDRSESALHLRCHAMTLDGAGLRVSEPPRAT